MKRLLLLSTLLLVACTAQTPRVTADKGVVYGVLTAEANSAFRAKHPQSYYSSVYGADKETGRIYKEDMVNYPALDELYVGLVMPDLSPQQHTIHVKSGEMSPRSLALAVGDRLQIYNDTGRKQTFFITQTPDNGDGIQSFKPLAAGSRANYPVQLAGSLELLSEDDATLKVSLFAKKNMVAKRLKSGESYQFENLTPGQYGLIFWYWRLGKIEQKIEVKAGESVRVDKTLSVDSILRSR